MDDEKKQGWIGHFSDSATAGGIRSPCHAYNVAHHLLIRFLECGFINQTQFNDMRVIGGSILAEMPHPDALIATDRTPLEGVTVFTDSAAREMVRELRRICPNHNSRIDVFLKANPMFPVVPDRTR